VKKLRSNLCHNLPYLRVDSNVR